MEVASEYLLGKSYREIEEDTGVSHGSIVNIVKELEKGELNIEGIPLEQVHDLRQLAMELKSKGFKPAQAMHGLIFHKRLTETGVMPEDLDSWSNLAIEIHSAGFQTNDFVEAVKRLIGLEKSHGKTLEELLDDYQKRQGVVERLREEVDLLTRNKIALSDRTELLHKESEELKKQRKILANEVEGQSRELGDVRSDLFEAAKEKADMNKEIDRLQRYKRKISSEVSGREEILRDLKETGFAQEDLLRLRAFLKRISRSSNESHSRVNEEFFSALASYKDILGLEKKQERVLQNIKELNKQRSALAGSIEQLENSKARLLGEIEKSVATAMQRIEKSGEEASLQLNQEIEVLRKQFEILLFDVLATGKAVGMMNSMIKRGELSQKEFRKFISEAQARLGGSTV